MLYLVFVFGLIAGSFLNVVIYRLKNDRNVIFGRSFCPECRTKLKWYDLMPIFSFVLLKGRCRYCREKIFWQYPIVEILSGLLWISVFYKVFGIWDLGFVWNLEFGIWNLFRISDFGFQIFDAVYYIFILSSFLVIAVYDFKWKIIPDKIVYPAIIAVLIFNLFNSFKFQNLEIFKYLNLEILKYLNIEIFMWPLFTASIAFLFFFLIYYFSSGRAMGLGDAKLAFLIGLFLTPSAAVTAFVLAFIIGAAFGIMLMGFGKILPRYGKWGMKSQIAFGPFLAMGTFIIFFLSDFIFKYLNF